MGKFLGAILILVLAYFAFLKRTEPPKEVPAPEEQTEQVEISPPPQPVSSPLQSVVTSVPVSVVTTALAATDSVLGDEGSLPDDADGSGELVKDERKDNVDQTIIGNEKRLAEARSATEVFELLRKLRVRPRKLGEISAVADAEDFAKFWGIYEGSVLNNRNEIIYTLKIELRKPSEDNLKTVGKYQIAKSGTAPTTHDLYSELAVQLVGRDSLVIENPDQQRHFQFYKLSNGYLAGNLYEKPSRRTRTYHFVLKNK